MWVGAATTGASGSGSMDRPLPTDPEPAWSQWLALQLMGEAEYVLEGGVRCDILTPSVAWEVDWAKKWPEAIGQACLYGRLSERRGGILLLTRRKPTESKYLERAAIACEVAGLLFLAWDTM